MLVPHTHTLSNSSGGADALALPASLAPLWSSKSGGWHRLPTVLESLDAVLSWARDRSEDGDGGAAVVVGQTQLLIVPGLEQCPFHLDCYGDLLLALHALCKLVYEAPVFSHLPWTGLSRACGRLQVRLM